MCQVADESEGRGKSEHPGIVLYLIAALTGNSLLLLTVLALTFEEPSVLQTWAFYVQLLIYAVMFASGALAGFLATRMVTSRHLIVGLIAGAFGYVISIVYSLFLLFLSAGLRELIAYCVGGVLGGFLRLSLERRGPHRRGQTSPEKTQ